MGLWEMFKEGGFIMYPLLLCSILIWAVVLEKFFTLKKFLEQNRSYYEKAREFLKTGQIEQALGLYGSAQELIARPFMTLLGERELPLETRNEKVYRRLMESQSGLRRFMWILGTIGSSAPFIGLFGTVVGIIGAFEDIAVAGKSGFSVVAGSLSEALIATAAGILVAVVATIFYNYFQTKLAEINLEFKHTLEDLGDYLQK